MYYLEHVYNKDEMNDDMQNKESLCFFLYWFQDALNDWISIVSDDIDDIDDVIMNKMMNESTMNQTKSSSSSSSSSSNSSSSSSSSNSSNDPINTKHENFEYFGDLLLPDQIEYPSVYDSKLHLINQKSSSHTNNTNEDFTHTDASSTTQTTSNNNNNNNNNNNDKTTESSSLLLLNDNQKNIKDATTGILDCDLHELTKYQSMLCDDFDNYLMEIYNEQVPNHDFLKEEDESDYEEDDEEDDDDNDDEGIDEKNHAHNVFTELMRGNPPIVYLSSSAFHSKNN